MKVPLRIRLKRPWRRLGGGLGYMVCQHDYETHDSKDEPGTTIYLCRKCVSGWKVT